MDNQSWFQSWLFFHDYLTWDSSKKLNEMTAWRNRDRYNSWMNDCMQNRYCLIWSSDSKVVKKMNVLFLSCTFFREEEARFKFFFSPAQFFYSWKQFHWFLERITKKENTKSKLQQENIFTHQPDDFNRFSRKCSYVSKKLWLNASQGLSEQCSKL